MRHTIWNKRIPSFFGLLFLSISVGIALWFGRDAMNFFGRANIGEIPENVQISNITDSSFTLSYTTGAKTTGTVVFGIDPQFGQVAVDLRDLQAGGATIPRQVHYITVTNLNPDSLYYFGIQSGSTTFLQGDLPYETTTASANPGAAANPPVIVGSVHLPDGSIPLDGIVSIRAESASNAASPESNSASQLVSVPLRQDGSYTVPVDSLRTEDLESAYVFTAATVLHMTILGAAGKSEVRLLASQANPVPQVSLTTDYDFTAGSNDLFEALTASESATASASGNLSPTATLPPFPASNLAAANVPDILVPQDGEQFSNTQPIFEGTALPNEPVEIIIDSVPPIQESIPADNFGRWQYRPEAPIASGERVITIITRNSEGIGQTLRRSFTVFAEGSQFTEPSVSPDPGQTLITPTTLLSPTIPVTPVELPTPTPTVAPTFMPTPTLTASEILSLTPPMNSLSLTPQSGTSLTPGANSLTSGPTSVPVPHSGSFSLVFAGFMVLVSIGAGVMLFLL